MQFTYYIQIIPELNLRQQVILERNVHSACSIDWISIPTLDLILKITRKYLICLIQILIIKLCSNSVVII
jgi:hypothetical protein